MGDTTCRGLAVRPSFTPCPTPRVAPTFSTATCQQRLSEAKLRGWGTTYPIVIMSSRSDIPRKPMQIDKWVRGEEGGDMTGIKKKYICSPAGILGGCQQFSRRGSRIPMRRTKHLGGISELCGIVDDGTGPCYSAGWVSNTWSRPREEQKGVLSVGI